MAGRAVISLWLRRLSFGGSLPMVGLLLSTGAAPVAGADFNYAAFGDSITAARAGNCNGSLCKIDDTNEFGHGGYPARLDSNDSDFGLGPGYRVDNKGVPGESTAEGLTRIDNVLNNGYHVLLLMEGINDMLFGKNPVSAETVKVNLREMEKKAQSWGTDTVYSTLMRRNRMTNNSQDKNLKNKILTLAGNRGRYVVNNYATFCPTLACFNANYFWDNIPEGEDRAGHPNAKGYDLMAQNWYDVITKTPIPGATTPIGPSGDIAGTLPTYTWDRVTRANYYHLKVKGPLGAVVENTWHRSSGNDNNKCTNDPCSTVGNTVLGDGLHSWTVRTRNPWGLGPVSAQGSFDVYANVPVAPVGIGPVGDYSVSLTEPFSWNEVDRTLDYRLVISDDLGAELHNQVYVGTTICNAGNCSVDDPVGLGGGSYTWQVFGQNPAGEGVGSSELAFNIVITAPGQATLLEPSWRTYDTSPEFSWLEVSIADSYKLKLNGVDQGGFRDAVDICADGICAITLAAPLAPGSYNWQIQAANLVGEGAFSPQTSFVLVDCSEPRDRTLGPDTVNEERMEEACDRLATSGVYTVLAPSGDLIFHTGSSGVIELFDGFSVESGTRFLAVVDQ